MGFFEYRGSGNYQFYWTGDSGVIRMATGSGFTAYEYDFVFAYAPANPGGSSPDFTDLKAYRGTRSSAGAAWSAWSDGDHSEWTDGRSDGFSASNGDAWTDEMVGNLGQSGRSNSPQVMTNGEWIKDIELWNGALVCEGTSESARRPAARPRRATARGPSGRRCARRRASPGCARAWPTSTGGRRAEPRRQPAHRRRAGQRRVRRHAVRQQRQGLRVRVGAAAAAAAAAHAADGRAARAVQRVELEERDRVGGRIGQRRPRAALSRTTECVSQPTPT